MPTGCRSNEASDRSGQAPYSGGRYYQDEGQVVEYWFLDVEGTPVMIEATWFAGLLRRRTWPSSEAVLDTLVITP